MEEVEVFYRMQAANSTVFRDTVLEEAERKPLRRGIRAVKEAVSIVDVAREYTELRQVRAERYAGLCPSPDHDDREPSFYVYADPRDPHFHCFGCGLHGDVLDLEEIAGRHAEPWTAMVALSVRYSVDLPRRSQRWHEATQRKARIRDAAADVRGKVLARRMFKLLVLPAIDATCPDPDEHAAELERAWADWTSNSSVWRGLGEWVGS